MVAQSDFPEKWQCDSEYKDAIVEVRAREGDEYTWVEIPTTQVEIWITKGEASSRQRTAKVRFPTEWGRTPPGGTHNSPKRLVEQFDPSDTVPFMFGRIKLQDEFGNWVLQHIGWIGGIGETGEPGMSKMWIYDFSEFLSGVPASKTFVDPSIKEAVEEISDMVLQNTGIPMSGVTIIAPQTEEELAIVEESALETDDLQGTSSGLDAETQYYALGGANTGAFNVDGEIDQVSGPFTSAIISTEDNFNPFKADGKHFAANHDTLLDVFKWYEEKTAGTLTFEPNADGTSVTLVSDVVPSRRTFMQKEVIRNEGSPRYHEPITVTENDALYEMKPHNTVHLRGSYPKGVSGTLIEGLSVGGLLGDGGTMAKKYPVVKVQVPSLIEAAEGIEVSGEIVESDARSLDEAEREAISALTRRLEEQGEGEIKMLGQPRIMPYDRVVSYEVCGDFVNYEPRAVEYEVEEVKHTAAADDVLRTDVRVSIWANDTNIETVEKRMVEVKE